MGSDKFDFLRDSAFLDCSGVILAINVELMPEMMLELKDLSFKFLIFKSDMLASALEGIELLRSDKSGIGHLLFDLTEMLSVVNSVVLNEGLQV